MTTYDQIQNGLTGLLRAWDRRARLQQTVAWSARALIPGLTLGVLLGLISRIRPVLTNGELFAFSIVAVIVGIGALLVHVWGRERPPVEAARRFDVTFGLQERTSTALELIEGRIRADSNLTERQIQDAYTQAQTIDADSALKLAFKRDEWLVALGLALTLAVMVIVPNAVADRIPPDPQRDLIIAQSIEDVEEAIETVATDAALDEEERQDLLEALSAALATLEEEAITVDEALALMGEVEGALRDRAGNIRQGMDAQNQALQDAADALNPEIPEEQVATPFDGLEQAMQNISEQIEGSMTLSEEERANAQAQIAQQLSAAAEALEAESPQMADVLEEAAQDMADGDTDGAQETLERAQDILQQERNDQQNAERSAQNMERAADRMREDNGADSAGEGDQDGDGDPQAGEAGDTPGDEGADGDEGENGGDGEDGQGDGSDEGDGDGGGDGDSDGDSGDGQGDEGDEGGDSDGQEGDGTTGIGSEQAGFDQSSEGTDGEQDFDEDAASVGQPDADRRYEPVFAPRRPDGLGTGEEIELEADAGGPTLREGDFTENPLGDVTVPYDQVFSAYADAANEALNQTYIPLGLRDAVRDYFTSLAPRRAADD